MPEISSNFNALLIGKKSVANKSVSIDLGNVKRGDIRFAYGMDMVSAHVIAE